jgi:pentatricopeptide repeat protein
VFQEAVNSGIVPTVEMATSMVKMYITADKLDHALELYKTMQTDKD